VLKFHVLHLKVGTVVDLTFSDDEEGAVCLVYGCSMLLRYLLWRLLLFVASS